MKAIVLHEFGGRDKLTLAEVPTPGPDKGEVLIKVKAAGVNPVDWKIREGMLTKRLPHRFPLIPGWDAAGIVAETGHCVKLFLPGDEVYAYCRKPVVQYGTYAEFIAVPERSVARKPSTLSFEEAAAVPLAALTAWQSLFEAVNLQSKETILILAAAGGVGSFAVQLAAQQGANIIGTCSAPNNEYVLSLGASRVINYTAENYLSAVRAEFPEGIDAVFDTIGGATAFAAMEVLKQKGRMVSIIMPKDKTVEEKTMVKDLHYDYVFVRPESEQLKKLAILIDQRKIKIFLSSVMPLTEAARAHEIIETGHTRGKIVLTV